MVKTLGSLLGVSTRGELFCGELLCGACFGSSCPGCQLTSYISCASLFPTQKISFPYIVNAVFSPCCLRYRLPWHYRNGWGFVVVGVPGWPEFVKKLFRPGYCGKGL